jgi:putative ABC transport system ATP-binding protein
MSNASETTPAYELREATRSYGENSTLVLALDGLSMTIESGEFVAVFGPSGSGKTTLLQLLGAMDRPSGGSILFEGKPLERLGDTDLAELRLRAMGFVFQQFNLIRTLSSVENVEASLAPLGTSPGERRQTAEEHLEAVGLARRAHHLPGQLSGGEQQRVAIARALARSPRVVLADEPPATLIPAAARWSWTCSPACTPSSSSRLCWSRTTSGSPSVRIAPSASPTGGWSRTRPAGLPSRCRDEAITESLGGSRRCPVCSHPHRLDMSDQEREVRPAMRRTGSRSYARQAGFGGNLPRCWRRRSCSTAASSACSPAR